MNSLLEKHMGHMIVASAIVGVLSLCVITGLVVRYLTVQSLEAQMVLFN